jgi:transposase
MLNNFTSTLLVYNKPTDMRKSINGLTLLVSSELGCVPSDGRFYIFYNKHFDKIKLLYWDNNGFCLLYKKLEKVRFKLPTKDASYYEISSCQLRWLLDGLDMEKLTSNIGNKYEVFY